MPLTGQAKTDYQREYMRHRRASGSVRPKVSRTAMIKHLKYPAFDGPVVEADTTVGPVTYTVRPVTVRPKLKLQNYNPMMAGYVPPCREDNPEI